jgi:hypothetical protein
MHNHAIRNASLIGALLASCMLAPACSSDEEPGAGGPGGTGGSAGKGFAGSVTTGGTGGKGGSGGSGGSGGGSGGAGGSGATGGTGGSGGGPEPVPCGSETCDPINEPNPQGGPDIVVPACCSSDTRCGLELDAATAGALGLEAGCNELAQAGTTDTGCPNAVLAVGGQNITFPGCCRASGGCGVEIDRGFLHLGCVESTLPREADAAVPATCGSDGGADAATDTGAAGMAGADSGSD